MNERSNQVRRYRFILDPALRGSTGMVCVVGADVAPNQELNESLTVALLMLASSARPGRALKVHVSASSFDFVLRFTGLSPWHFRRKGNLRRWIELSWNRFFATRAMANVPDLLREFPRQAPSGWQRPARRVGNAAKKLISSRFSKLTTGARQERRGELETPFRSGGQQEIQRRPPAPSPTRPRLSTSTRKPFTAHAFASCAKAAFTSGRDPLDPLAKLLRGGRRWLSDLCSFATNP